MLDLSNFNLTKADLDQEFQVGEVLGLGRTTLRAIIDYIKSVYSGTLTCDVAGCEPNIQAWFQSQFETARLGLNLAPKRSARSYTRSFAREFRKFIHTRFVGTKRFSSKAVTR